MADLWILGKNDKTLAVLSSEAEGACTFWGAPFREELNQGSTFKFTCDRTHSDSKYVAQMNQVVFKDKDGFFRLFKIREIDRDSGPDGKEKTAHCEPAEMELLEKIIDDVRPQNTTQQDALNRALVGTRWKGNVTADFGINSTNFYHISVYEAITEIIKVWGGELRFTIEFDEKANTITERVVNIVPRRGEDAGDRFEVGYNIDRIHETVMAYPVTALYGWGASEETENGGHTRYLNFADVEWKVSNGDPVDKPKGQKWVEYPPAKEEYGIEEDGTILNLEGQWQDENIKDAEELLQKTYEQLVNAASKIQSNYELEVVLQDEPVSLGDTRLALDRTTPDPIEFSGRVIALEYDVSDLAVPAKAEMGQFLDVYEPDKRIDDIEDQIKNIDRDVTVTDENFPDTKPPTPTNVTAEGRFAKVSLSWDFEPYSYIAKYEVYGSQVKDFTPDTTNKTNLLWAGKEGGWVHEADVNQVWYYRIRAVNTHGTASDFTAQYSAATVRIGTKHIEYQSITNALMGVAAIDTANIADAAITNAKIDSLIADKIKGGILSGVIVRSDNDQGDTIELKDGTLISKINSRDMIKMANFNLYFYDSGEQAPSPDYREVGRLANAWDTSDPSTRGFAVNGRKDYLSLGRQTAESTSQPAYRLDFNDRSTILAGAIKEDGKWNGRLSLRSTYLADWGKIGKNSYVPQVAISNYNEGSTKWGGVYVYTGRSSDAPGGSNKRFGFEVWQYQGTGSAVEQLFKIDRSSTGQGNFMAFYGDTAYLPYNVRLESGDSSKNGVQGMGLSLSNTTADVRGDLTSNATMRIYYWDGLTLNNGSGSTAWAEAKLDIGSNVEKIYFATVIPYGNLNDGIVCGIQGMSAGNHFINARVRGTGAYNVKGYTVTRLMFLYIYEPK
ncbi:phage tail spike protein [Bacillus paralicheniformis]|uniref:phage tail spike protein n=1 Tax=Bacillus paralicheniformis TaxID=1648923 RepID=UPI001CC3CD66|nr:phage tail spike protein [Bacillus paralicheniformis]UAY70742.1 phage tail protein [Bacillus paralicheniformis]